MAGQGLTETEVGFRPSSLSCLELVRAGGTDLERPGKILQLDS